MTRKEKSLELFEQGFNCSQAIFTAYRQPDELSDQAALRLATVFGAGVAGSGRELCGAVTGALMAISLRHGRGDIASLQAKAATYELGKRFMAEFLRRNRSCVCEQILGVNIGAPERLQEAREKGLFKSVCPAAVGSAADILEELL